MISDLSSSSIETLRHILEQTRNSDCDKYLSVHLMISVLEDTKHPVRAKVAPEFLEDQLPQIIAIRDQISQLLTQIDQLDNNTTNQGELIQLINLHERVNSLLDMAHNILMLDPSYAGADEEMDELPGTTPPFEESETTPPFEESETTQPSSFHEDDIQDSEDSASNPVMDSTDNFDHINLIPPQFDPILTGTFFAICMCLLSD